MGISRTINKILTSSNPNIKIVKQTSGILDLQVSRIGYFLRLPIALLGFLIIISGFVSILKKESVILECDRLESNYVDCQIHRSNLLGKKTTDFPQLKQAEIKTIDYDDITTYRINLLGSKVKVSLTRNAIDNEFQTRGKFNQINNFLANNNTSNPYLTVNYNEPFSVYIFGFIRIIAGGITVFSLLIYPLNTNYILDKEKNTLWLIKKNIFQSKKIFQCQLSDITEAVMVEEERIDDDQPIKVYHLVLKKGSFSIPLKAEEIEENGMIVLTSDTIEIMEEIIKNHIILKAEGIETNKNQYIDIKDSINNFLR